MIEKKKSEQVEIRNKISVCLFLEIPTSSQVREKRKKKSRKRKFYPPGAEIQYLP